MKRNTKTKTLEERKKHGRRYSEDSISQTGRHFEAGILSVEDVARYAGISTMTLYAWAKKRGWKHNESRRVVAVDGRGLLRMASIEAIESARTKFDDAPPAVSPALLTAGSKGLAMSESWAEAQPASVGLVVLQRVQLSGEIAGAVRDGVITQEQALSLAERLDKAMSPKHEEE